MAYIIPKGAYGLKNTSTSKRLRYHLYGDSRISRYKVYAKERKQTENLNVKSPAPETISYAVTKKDAERMAKDKRKDYYDVKVVKFR